jgi:hypothetical protein
VIFFVRRSEPTSDSLASGQSISGREDASSAPRIVDFLAADLYHQISKWLIVLSLVAEASHIESIERRLGPPNSTATNAQHAKYTLLAASRA